MSATGRFTLSSLRVSQKIFGVLGFLVLCFTATILVTLWRMNSITAEIEEIADRQMPLTEVVTQVSLNQLEQAIYFERILRLGYSSSGVASRAVLDPLVAAFEKDGTFVNEKVVVAEDIVAQAITATTLPTTGQRYEAILASLKHFEAGHKVYEEHARELIGAVRRGDTNLLERKIPGVIEEEEKLDHEIAEILLEIEHLTADSLNVVKEHEVSAVWTVVFMAIAAIAVGGTVSFLIVRGIVGPLHKVVDALTALAGGDTVQHVEVVGEDEIAQTARAYGVLRKTTEEAQELAARQKMLDEAENERRQRIDRLTQEFDRSVASVLSAMEDATGTLETTSKDMSAAAHEGKSQTATVSAATEETSTNVQVVASAAEEMSASISEVSNTIAKTAQVTQQAVSEAERTNRSVTSLAEAASKIGDVVDLISDIADQTNLLALNATIEAARAGEAGKGFAVVASEVKELATQTAKATSEITTQISDIQTVTGDSVAAISGITKTIGEIDDYSSMVSSSIEEQMTATHEISGSVQQAAMGTQELSQSMVGVQKTAEISGDAANRVDGAVGDLSRQADALKHHVDQFLENVRTA
ncbi:MAG: HAMP domain-containing protein [Rhodobiaceae bacterium]|nr:HAMP domain-containing protein [Rhodobiaceae bacterium]